MSRSAYVINTYSYTSDHTALECLRHLSGLGFRAFETMLVPGHFWPGLDGAGERNAIGALLASQGLEIETLNQPNLDINLAALTPECRDYSCAVIGSALELAADWGARGVVVNPGKANPVFPPPTELLADRFRSSLDILVPKAESLGVRLVVKNHPLSWMFRGRDLTTFFDNYGWSGIALGYDVANAVFGREDVVGTIPLLRDRLAAIYASDTPLDEFRHDRAGGGAVPFKEIAVALASIGYAGPTILEIVDPAPDEALRQTVDHLVQASWPARPALGGHGRPGSNPHHTEGS